MLNDNLKIMKKDINAIQRSIRRNIKRNNELPVRTFDWYVYVVPSVTAGVVVAAERYRGLDKSPGT